MEAPNIFEEKKEIRKKIKEIKKRQTEKEKEDASSEILKEIELLPAFQYAKTILAYWSLRDEVTTHEFIEKWRHNKTILLPVTIDDKMYVKPFHGKDRLIINSDFGIAEPDSEIFEDIGDIDLIIVPGVAFDKNNNRLGRGKAFYDRFLSEISAYKIGVCFNFQLLSQIPCDENDIKMDLVVSH